MSEDGFILSSAQAHEIEIAMNRPANGEWTPELVHLLTKGDTLGDIRELLLGHASITMGALAPEEEQAALAHVIDCDADPYLPGGWKGVEEHQKGGSLTWDASQVSLYLSNSQQKGSYIRGHKLRKELAGKPVLNANVLDYLLAHPELIPESWKGQYVFFWGTIYRRSGDLLFVRFLYWNFDRWRWGFRWLHDVFLGHYPAALRAS